MQKILPEHIANKVDCSGDCWVWKAAKVGKGYGSCQINGKNVRAHRYSWEYFNGHIPDDLQVLHKCDVRNCINPAHLFLGTPLDNALDRKAKNRSARGEKQGSSKLTKSEVDEIRRTYQRGVTGAYSQRGLAKRFGVHQTNIGYIVNHKQW